MPLFQGFIGPMSTSRSRTVDDQATVNLYCEQVESGLGKDRYALYGRPGNTLFSEINGGQGQAMLEIQGRCFACIGGFLYEINAYGDYSKIGPVGTTAPVSMAANPSQLIVTSTLGGGWILPLDNAAGYGRIASPGYPLNADSVTYMDSYFIVTQGDTQEFFISAPNDGTSWSALDFASKEGYPDYVVAVQMVRRQLWVFGSETSEIWWDSGNANFPFQPIQGALVQVGLAAVRSSAIVGNGLFWLGQNNRGKAVAFAEQNFAPIRVSNHAVEAAWEAYPVISDAIGYGYEENGHTFYVLSFPTAQATWVLDTKTGFWHQWDWWNSVTGSSEAALARFHCFCFNEHLTLDWKFGNIYKQSLNTYTDAGSVIRRIRRAPHVDQSKHRLRHVRLQLDIEIGTTPVGTNPTYSMRFSDDGGFTWSNELIRYVGQAGRYANQLIWRQLGSSRDRVYEISSTANCNFAWAAAYLETVPSNELQ